MENRKLSEISLVLGKIGKFSWNFIETWGVIKKILKILSDNFILISQAVGKLAIMCVKYNYYKYSLLQFLIILI